VDNGGIAAIDANMNLTITLTDEAPQAPVSTDLGSLAAPGAMLSSQPLPAGQVRWYRFTLPVVALADRSTFLDVDTAGSLSDASVNSPFPNDTEIALYADDGRRVALDDDSGPGFTSVLTCGAGGRPAIGDGIPLDGRHGPLPPGTYYLAVAWNGATFGAERWEVLGGGSMFGTINLRLQTNISATFPCLGDWNGNGQVNSSDISAFLTIWLASISSGTPLADVNGDGVANSSDISGFLSAWLAALQNGC
jgi:hypothetical protein